MAITITQNTAAMQTLSSDLCTKKSQFMTERLPLEQQCLTNLRQYRAKYDPEILAILNSEEFKTRSKVYPRDTRVKINGFVAKMMEMMFPATERNWGLDPTPFPNMPEQDIARIIEGLTKQKISLAQQASQEGGILVDPEVITSREIEELIKKLATERAGNMATEIEDQLADIGGERIEYPQLVKRIIRSAAIYGFGIAEGPLIRSQEERTWAPGADGKYAPVMKSKRRPYLEQVKVWDIFPDLSAKTWREQDGIFRRRIFLKNGLNELGARKDFDADVVKQFILDNPDGNYVVMNYEAELDAVNNKTSTNKTKKGRYEVFRFLGYIAAEKLIAAGIAVKDKDKNNDVLADVWLLGDKVIKADVSAFGTNPADSFFVFVYEDDEESGLTGVGLPESLRDSQMRLCAIDRATMDNMGAVAGPIFVSNKALLGRNAIVGAIHAFQTIQRDDDNPATAGMDAVKQLNTNSYVMEYIALRGVVKQILDYESNLPSVLMGDPSQLGEAFRTSGNMSMLTGAANMVTKDIVRSFDRFTSSIISALVQWNMEFNDKEEIHGDYQVQAKGSLSLVAKEIRGAALDQLWATMEPEDKAIVKRRLVLVDRFKSRDLPEDYIESEEDSKKILDGMAQAAAAAAQTESAFTQAKTQKSSADAQKSGAQAQEIMQLMASKLEEAQASITSTLANAKGVKDRGNLEHIQLLLSSIQQAASQGTGGRAAGESAKG